MLPKVHTFTVNPFGRPVISGNYSLTEPVSKYSILNMFTPFLLSLPAYVQNTPDVLNKIKQLEHIGTGFSCNYGC